MSAQVVDRGIRVAFPSAKVNRQKAEEAEDNRCITNKIRSEILYQMCFAPEPTPDQIAMEEFLLECD